MWIWKRQKVSAYTCLFFHLSWRKKEALDLTLSKTVSFCFKRWKPVLLWGGARKWKKEEKGGSLEVRKLNEEAGWSLAGCRDPWPGVHMIKGLLHSQQLTLKTPDHMNQKGLSPCSLISVFIPSFSVTTGLGDFWAGDWGRSLPGCTGGPFSSCCAEGLLTTLWVSYNRTSISTLSKSYIL